MMVKLEALPNEIKTTIEQATKGWQKQKTCFVHQYPQTLEILVQGIDDKGRSFVKIFPQKGKNLLYVLS